MVDNKPGFLRWDGTQYTADPQNNIGPLGRTGGDLIGFYPSPITIKEVFVYRDSEPNPTGNIFPTFNAAYNARKLTKSQASIEIDDTLNPGNAQITPGIYDLTDTILNGISTIPGLGTNLTCVGGNVTLQNLAGLKNVALKTNSNTTPNIIMDGSGFGSLYLYNSSLAANGSAPLLEVQDNIVLYVVLEISSNIINNGSSAINLIDTATLAVIALGGSTVGNNSISGVVGTTLVTAPDASSLIGTLSGFLGTPDPILLDKSKNVGYAPGTPGNWSPVPNNVSDALDQLSGETHALNGDVTGPTGSNTVVRIQGTPVSSASVTNDGYALVSTGGQYVPTGVAPVFNVKNFGAKGNGIQDDTSFINLAIMTASVTGGTVYLPIGIYSVSSSINLASNIVLRGDGYNSIIAGSITNLTLITATFCNNIRIEGLQILAKKSDTTGTGILCSLCSSVIIQQCFTNGFGLNGINVIGGDNTLIINNTIRATGASSITPNTNGIYVLQSLSSTANDNIRIISNDVGHVGQGIACGEVFGITISNNNIHDITDGTAQHGMYLAGNDMVVTGNTVYRVNDSGIKATYVSAIDVFNINFNNNTVDGYWNGINGLGQSNGIEINGPVFPNTGALDGYLRNATIANNSIQNFQGSGIAVGNLVIGFDITNNVINNTGSAGILVEPGAGIGPTRDGNITNNILTEICSISAHGIELNGDGGILMNIIIDDNIIDGVPLSNTSGTVYSIFVGDTTNAFIRRNRMIGSAAALDLASSNFNVIVQDNIADNGTINNPSNFFTTIDRNSWTSGATVYNNNTTATISLHSPSAGNFGNPNQGAIWLGAAAISPTDNNLTLASDSSGATYLHTSGSNIYMGLAGNFANLTLSTNLLQWGSGVIGPSINQAPTSSGSGNNFTIQAQNATGASNNGGNLIFAAGTSGSATNGSIDLQTGGTNQATISTTTITLGIGATNTSTLLQVAGSTTASLVANKFVTNKGRRRNVTNTTISYLVLASDDIIAVGTLSSGITVTLPTSATVGDAYDIKDTVGGAATNNITIDSGSGNKIDSARTFVMSTNYSSMTLVCVGTSPNQWSIL